MKIKKRTEERKEGFPIKDQKEVKREKKQFSINERKRTKILQARLPFEIILDWQYPTLHKQRGKDRNNPYAPIFNNIPAKSIQVL